MNALRLKKIMGQLDIEVRQAMSKHNRFNSPHEGWAVILEELDEMWDAIKENQRQEARAECIQVAAMCIRYLHDIE